MTVEPITPETRAHPLGTQQGVDLILQGLAAGELWRTCTPVQRQVLRSRYLTVRAEVARAGETGQPVREVHVEARLATCAALERRGLVVASHGRWVLTGDGMAVVWWWGGEP